MVANPIQLPKFPGSTPESLTRKQGAGYAQRVLRQLDGLPTFQERLDGLLWAIEEMTRVRDAIADAHGEAGATFFEGILGGFAAAQNEIRSKERANIANQATAMGCREKAARLITYAEMLEKAANDPIKLADGRFK